MFTTAGAELGPTRYATAIPAAQNGIAPNTSTMKSVIHCVMSSRTFPHTTAIALRSITSTALNATVIAYLPKKYALRGIGLARFTASHPCPRSTATPIPRDSKKTFRA